MRTFPVEYSKCQVASADRVHHNLNMFRCFNKMWKSVNFTIVISLKLLIWFCYAMKEFFFWNWWFRWQNQNVKKLLDSQPLIIILCKTATLGYEIHQFHHYSHLKSSLILTNGLVQFPWQLVRSAKIDDFHEFGQNDLVSWECENAFDLHTKKQKRNTFCIFISCGKFFVNQAL